MPSNLKTSFSFTTKTAYDKSGRLHTSTMVKKTVRNEKGKFISNKKIALPQMEASRFFKDIQSGKLSPNRASGIFESYAEKSPIGLVKSGFNSMIQIMGDQHALSDLQKKRLSVLGEKMSIEDFENFYKRYQDDIDAIYESSDAHKMRSSDGQILSWDKKHELSDKIIKDMGKYLGLEKRDMDKLVNEQDYNERGRLKFKQ